MVFVFSLVGCSSCPNSGDARVGVDNLDEQITQWQEGQIKNYVLTYEKSCFCPSNHIEVTVVDGVIAGVIINKGLAGSEQVVSEAEYAQYYIVGDFFDLITEYDDEVDRLEVQYDASLGYPSTIWVDPHADRNNGDGTCTLAIDDEFSYTIEVNVSG